MDQRPGNRNPIERDGTSQSQRRLDVLNPARAPIDGRDIADFLVFAKEFARVVVYKDDSGTDRGDWEGFFGCDASAVIAAIKKTNPEPIREAINGILLSRRREPAGLRQLLEHLTALIRMLDDWYRQVGRETAFHAQIGRLIQANLGTIWQRLVASHRAISAQFPTVSFNPAAYQGFSDVWFSEALQPRPAPRAVAPDPSLLQSSGSEDKQLHAAYERLEALFTPIYRVLLEVIRLAPRYFARDLVGRSDHAPHFALFVAFLLLYLQVRNDANRLTQRHLEFFYDKVLRIKKRPAVPDKLHLVVELARQGGDEHKLSAGTELDAGKDETDKPLRYRVDKDLVVNRAQITSFKTVFVDYSNRDADNAGNKDAGAPKNGGDEGSATPARFPERVVAAHKADSADGRDAPIEDKEPPSWSTLGNTAMPAARLGFLLASKDLLLAEGTRQITLNISASGCPPGKTNEDLENALEDALIAQLSGAKGWIRVPPDSTFLNVIDNEPADAKTLQLILTLASTVPAVTLADEEALGEGFGTTAPLLKVTVADYSRAYGLLKGLRLAGVELKTSVAGMTGLIVQNDQSAVDPTKPFQPFGPSPAVGSSLYIGSAEAFQKDLEEMTLDITWDGLPESFATHYEGYDVAKDKPATSDFTASIQLLQDGDWLPDAKTETVSLKLFDVGQNDDGVSTDSPKHQLVYWNREYSQPSIIDFPGLGDQQPRVIDALAPWTPATQHGFLRLRLDAPKDAFFHDQYVRVLTRQSLAAASVLAGGDTAKCMLGAKYRVLSDNGKCSVKTCTGSDSWDLTKAVAIIPNEPYTPTIKALKLGYKAISSTDKSSHGLTFFHLEPFGYRAVPLGPTWQEEGVAITEPPKIGPPPLLPQIDEEGSLFLGLKHLKPRQGLSILFQVAEATADTNISRPVVIWSYLTDDRWEDFEKFEIIEDTTSGLTGSGVITFAIPRDIASTSTRMPGQLHWLRAAVRKGAKGVSELIAAHTQAVRATFVDDGNSPRHLEKPLKSESIAGLVVDDSKVAGVKQPYDSFGGRPVESDRTFFTRVSERLRHKGRPITLFDYERLILERFPNLYKVKCINHTRISYANGVDAGKDEFAPGHVLIAVIADFKPLKAVDRQRPRVTLDKLEEISKYLQEINCPFVQNHRADGRQRLHLSNPVYEEVKVALSVRFKPHVTSVAFHLRKLQDEVIKFLSPWAYSEGAEISFGGRIYRSAILNFVVQRSYVDFVTDFVMTHTGDDNEVLSSGDLDFIKAATPRSILVPALEHEIIELKAGACEMTRACPPEQSLGQMTVGEDFVIRPNPEDEA